MNGLPALLRAPPFPGFEPDAAPDCSTSRDLPDTAGPEIVAALTEARVGGEFWAEPIEPALSGLPKGVIVARLRAEQARDRPASSDELLLIRGTAIDPWSVLPHARRLIANGDDDWVALASIIGIEVDVLSPGVFGAPEDTPETLRTNALRGLAQGMRDPFSQGWLAPFEAIALLAEWRRVIDANRGPAGARIVAACGISWWKRAEIRQFLWSPGEPLRIFSNARRALDAARTAGGALAIWPSRINPQLIADASAAGVPLVRVEDGFVRSVGLGSDLVPPLSVIVDRLGIHYDPAAPSDLEHILGHAEFPQALLDRAVRLRKTIVEAGISKYDGGLPAAKIITIARPSNRVVLVPGQVEDDMSVLAGGGGLSSNLELLRRVRRMEPEAEIWWRPHPDVDAGHRNGFVADEDALEHADRIMREGSMAQLLDHVDAVHVLTSLSGFEALLRGCEVTCHGTPFYSGWGLTRDLADVPDRRGRSLTLDQLVAGVLLLYPRYLDPVTGLPCPPEVLVQRMAHGKAGNRLGWIGPVRRAQGRMMARIRKRSRG